ncbi:MAG TPA: ATP-binding protein [Hyphomicrobiaceae bacterium]|nr:ATP-binding protein [Hyphomicrobiaceae bacterium]
MSMSPSKSTELRPGNAGVLFAVSRALIDHEQLLSVLPHPIVVLDADDRFAYSNAAGEQFFSMSEGLLQRQALGDLVGPSSPLVALVQQVRRTGATVNEYGVEAALLRLNTSRLVDVFGGPLHESSGLVLLMLQQRSMAQMIERQFTHRAAARSVSGLASVLAHEIKNPLSGIRGAAQLLEPGLASDDRSLTQLICSETDRIRNLVDRMEVFGDERPIKKETVNIHAILDHVRRLASSGFASGLKIQEEYDPSLPLIPAHRDKLVQAFLNLVKNGAEAIEEGARESGRLVLRTAFRPGVRLAIPGASARISLPFMIEIEDNGPGVPEALREQLFDPFVTTKRTGTGLGLALVAKIIGDHGGIIECDSQPGRTIFRVLLPVSDATPGVPTRKKTGRDASEF